MANEMKNVLLKLSGEAFGGECEPFDVHTISAYAKAICEGLKTRQKIYVVCGGGNVCRGRSFGDHVLADFAGMLASVQNALFLTIALSSFQIQAQVVTPDNFTIPHTCSESEVDANTRVIIYSAGVGEPGHSTDYVCAVKALEHDCDIYFAKFKCNGVYDRDPNGKDRANAVFFPTLSFSDIVRDDLRVIDRDAAALLSGTACNAYIFELIADNIAAMLTGNTEQVHKTEIHA